LLERTLAELTSVASSEGEPLFFNYSRDKLESLLTPMIEGTELGPSFVMLGAAAVGYKRNS
jgi:hypothetical protein